MPDPSLLDTLVHQARAGDRAAREELLGRHRSWLVLLAREQTARQWQGRVDASDLVQQTLLDAHRAFDRFRGETGREWLVWLRQILRNNLIDCARRHAGAARRQVGREQSLQSPFDSTRNDDPAGPVPTPSAVVAQRELEAELADAILRLPEDYQQVILLRNLDQLPFDEIAARMNRSRPAVQMLWMRAVRALRGLMSGQDGQDS